MERTIVQPVMPREIDLKSVKWLTVTPDNWEEQLKIIEEQEMKISAVVSKAMMIL